MRTVLVVDPFGSLDPATGSEVMVLKAIRSPFKIKGADLPRVFKLAPAEMPAWGVPDAVRLRGQLIRDRLGEHPKIKELLAQLDGTPLTDVNPLFVVLSEGDAELISWETLCNATNEFVALDKRWPIGRISDPMTGQSRPPAALRLPVKVMAIISAFGVHGQAREWELFREALLAARAKGLDIQLKLLVGEPGLWQAINDAIAAGLQGVEVAPIGKTGSQIIQEVIEWAPNVVHFFCHGFAEAGEQWLELAKGSDYADPDATGGTVKIRTKQLVEMSLELPNPWLLTLNCCASGQGGKDLQSMAHQVVSAGFPAAVAMLEPVDASDAHEFTDAFYHYVLPALPAIGTKLVAEPQVAFEWVCAMHAARTAICDLHDDGENSREWALPILYVRGIEPFHFVRPHQHYPEKDLQVFKMKAGMIADALRLYPQDMDAARRIALMEKTLADVPKEFWPTADGTFANG
jgi:hypothetical protein